MHRSCVRSLVRTGFERCVVMMMRAVPSTFSTVIDGAYVRQLVTVYAHVELELSDATAIADAFRDTTFIYFESDLREMLSNDVGGLSVNALIDKFNQLVALPHVEVFVDSLRRFIERRRALLATLPRLPSLGECVCVCTEINRAQTRCARQRGVGESRQSECVVSNADSAAAHVA
jgi:hypothetical protein